MKKFKRTLAFLLTLTMLLTAIPLSVWAESSASAADFAGGNGTEESPYLIATKEQLDNVRKNLDAHYKMTADIKFTEADFSEGGAFYNNGDGWKPIGEANYWDGQNTAFNGTFDGDNHVIDGLRITLKTGAPHNAATERLYVGLFGGISGINGMVKNVILNNNDISVTVEEGSTPKRVSVGGISAQGKISNCVNNGNISISGNIFNPDQEFFVGGIAGGGGELTNCRNTGNVSVNVSVFGYGMSTNDICGVFVGGISGSYGKRMGCENTGAVSAIVNGNPNLQGIKTEAGGITASDGHGRNGGTKVSNCSNSGTVYASISNVNVEHFGGGHIVAGGIATIDVKEIRECVNSGTVSTVADGTSFTYSHTGGIAGSAEKIIKCSNSGDVTAINVYRGRIGGIAGSGYATKITDCYNTGKVHVSAPLFEVNEGGIVGKLEKSSVSSCYNIGEVSTSNIGDSKYIYSGGIAGYIYDYSNTTINNCYYLNTSEKGVGYGTDTATKCTDEQMKQKSTFVGFDFGTVWKMDNSYPYLIPRFNPRKDAWSFANSKEGFGYGLFSYSIPVERYSEVFGDQFVAAATIEEKKNIFSKAKFNSMIEDSWNGNCFGMSTTSVLFNLGLLDWNDYNEYKGKTFENVNDYYSDVKGGPISPELGNKYYTASDKKTEITKLIERYQVLLKGGTGSAVNRLRDDAYYSMMAGYTTKLGDIGDVWEHNPGGKYIEQTLEQIQNSSVPLIVDFAGMNKKGKIFGHAMVTRTDIEPELVENGWYRVYVYDPNHPYYPKDLQKGKDAAKSCYIDSNSKGSYIELKPSENKWRYNAGAVNSSSESSYVGCDSNWNVRYYTSKDDSGNDLGTIPEYMYVYDISDCNFPTVFDGTDRGYWDKVVPEDSESRSVATAASTTLYLSDNSSVEVYSTDGELLCSVNETGVAALGDAKYYPVVGETVDGDSCGKGQVLLPGQNFTVKYLGGDDISLVSNGRVINVACDGTSALDVAMGECKIDIKGDTDNKVVSQITDVSKDEGHTSVYISGELKKDDKVSFSFLDDHASVNADFKKDSWFDVYTDNETMNDSQLISKITNDNQSDDIEDVRDTVPVEIPAPIPDITINGSVIDGDVAYVKLPSVGMLYKNHSATLGFKIDPSVEVQSIKWSYDNWSVSNPEANIESPDSAETVIRPNGKGIGARSTWVKITVTDTDGNVYEKTIKVRFYKWDWQRK